MTTNRRSRRDRWAGLDISGPALGGSEHQALLQAMRNLWPLLGAVGRKQATSTAKGITANQ